ncbi:MAG: SDR family oxidoreductase [Phycisphaerales bacterium JB058]
MTHHEAPFGPKGWTPERLGDQGGKTFAITGANVGLGYEASRLLLARGASVVMLCRNPRKAEEAMASLRGSCRDGATVQLVRMDLASLRSVSEAAERVKQVAPRLDALICNAAIAQVATRRLTPDGFESQLGVNHLGHFLLSGLLFEHIEAASGRIVVVGSMGYNMGLKRIRFEDLNFDKEYSAWAAYAQSKLAQMMSAYELERRVREAGGSVGVHVCHPGWSKTTLVEEEGSLATRLMLAVMAPFMAQSAERGSWPEVLCATESDLQPSGFYGPTGMGYFRGPVGACELKAHALDRDAARQLWSVSEEMVGLRWSP